MPLKAIPLQHQEQEEGNCGYFAHYARWTLEGESGPGMIVQKVQRIFDIWDIQSNRQLTDTEVDAYARVVQGRGEASAAVKEYWEAWFIPLKSAVPTYSGLEHEEGGNTWDDCFSMTRVTGKPRATKDTTKGSFEIRGYANYYPLAGELRANAKNVLGDFGFAVDHSSPAGILPVRRQAPDLGDRMSTSFYFRKMIAKWDSSTADPVVKGFYGETKVFKLAIRGGK